MSAPTGHLLLPPPPGRQGGRPGPARPHGRLPWCPWHGCPDGPYDAWLFDLDGVLTRTDEVHAAAWRSVLDRVLADEADRTGRALAPFDPGAEYRATVDGRPRADGVRAFLAARGIARPEGARTGNRSGHRADDPEDDTGDGARPLTTVEDIAAAKDEVFTRLVASGGVPVHAGAVALVRALRAKGIATAVVSASENARAVLAAAGLTEFVDARVDGVVARNAGLAGKPAPDTFLEAARRLDVPPERAVVVEDSRVGVEAGRRGGFGLVVGVAGPDGAGDLVAAGADIVVAHLVDLLGRDELGLGHRHLGRSRWAGRMAATRR